MRSKIKVFSIVFMLLIITLMTIKIFHLNGAIKSNKDIIKKNNEIIENQKYEISRLKMIEDETYELFVNCVEMGQE